jgi:peroxiredoxin Q/BCP
MSDRYYSNSITLFKTPAKQGFRTMRIRKEFDYDHYVISRMQLRVLDDAPQFESITDTGEKFSLSDYREKSNVVLYFYPKDFTMGCTKEACSFRDYWEKVTALGATIIGVSSDDPETHARFKKEHSLQFTLVSDENNTIRKLYGVEGRFIPSRITFVIDKRGKIRSIFNSQLNVTKHIEKALESLDGISSEAAA